MLMLNSQFSILFVARTGSTYLQDALNNHPNITCTNDDLLVNYAFNGGGDLDPKFDFHPNIVFGHSGIKVPIDMIRKYPLSHGFWSTNVWDRPMVICTRNPLHSYMSYVLVKNNGSFWYGKDYIRPVTIDVQRAECYIRGMNNILKPFIQLKNQHKLILKYEDGVENCYRKTLDFLEIEYSKPKSMLTRQLTKPLKDMVLNYQEVKRSTIGYMLD
jgi:hypothetical protein